MELHKNNNGLVSYSRAGDVFHYRWAARRSLKLIQSSSDLESVVIEGSEEEKKAGEYVIDVCEYYNSSTSKKRIEYYQLKHTTVQQDNPFTISDLKDTIVGFSKRFQQHDNENSLNGVSFTIITNRKISESFKLNLDAIIKRGNVNEKFKKTIKKYTDLNGDKLIQFCRLLSLEDGEGDYSVQKEDLRIEMARLQPGSIDSAQIDSIVSLVQEKVLPNSNGKIIKEEILRPFGVTSEKQLFPAPGLFEKLDNVTIRKSYNDLIDSITLAIRPVIIHAEGGVGKSVFSQYVIRELPEGSLGISYDCFGSGKYRSRSEPRHRHRDALVQIANELASMGLCERMLIKDTTHENDIMRGFLKRIELSIKSLKQTVDSAKLFILIDAADNAEMAAQEFGDPCFANELLREKFSQDCKMVLLCRPERIHLLKPPGDISTLNLPSFSKEETLENLEKWFPDVNVNEGLEFHRLTNGNPRVQMNSIEAGLSTVNELLEYLGPHGTTVEKQIEQQLNNAVLRIKDSLPENFQSGISKICTGLASLPPNIPIQVLSLASEVTTEDVKSFVSDMGRSLWLLDSSVQFRDEPTETWFRNTYLGSKVEFGDFIKALEPFACELTYVAEVLPQLYLLAGQYDQLINAAISDSLLPLNNPIDTRNVRVYRLQFAFKAALRSDKFKDAIKIALRAGEEVAGDKRQQSLFLNNLDLLPKLQDKLKVKELAFKGHLKSAWEGSEIVFAASLLSEIKEYKGEASGYLRSAMNWLQIYFEEAKENKDNKNAEKEGVSFEDILEIALAHLNLYGARSCLKFLNKIKPKESIFRVVKNIINRLIDANRFNEINEILKIARRNKFHVVAIVSELGKIGYFPISDNIEKCLVSLSNSNNRIKKSSDFNHDNLTPSIVTFLEVCVHRKLNNKAIIEALDYYVPNVAFPGIASNYDSRQRKTYLRALSIRAVISGDSNINMDQLMPEIYKIKDKKRDYTDEIREFKETIGGLFPWYLLRAQLISGNNHTVIKRASQASEASKKASTNRYKNNDRLPNEVANISSSILIYCDQQKPKVVQQYYDKFIRDNSSFTGFQQINLLRIGNRTLHLKNLLPELEHSAYEFIKGLRDSGPEEIADYYISLSRAVLSVSNDDAAVYFEEAINIVSKFGDEIVERWEALVALGEQSSPKSSDELAYRFIRCSELVGEYVDREKHWDRSGAIITCTKMSTQIGISALSRWRDREVGRFEYQLESQLDYLVRSKTISSAVGWSMARFFSNHDLKRFLSTCMEHELSKKLRNEIFVDAFELVRKEGVDSDYWIDMQSIANNYDIRIKELDVVVDFYRSRKRDLINLPYKRNKEIKIKRQKNKWKQVFHHVDVLNPNDVETIINRFTNEFLNEEKHHYLGLDNLFQEVFQKINANQIHDLIDSIFESNKLSFYDFQDFLRSIPIAWKSKVSFKKKWPSIITRFGTRYAHELVNFYSFKSSVQDLVIEESITSELRKGVFQGLSQGQEFANASVLFGYVRHASNFINSDDACDLAEYAISRFELHIEDNFGDGLWGSWLEVTNDNYKNIAGFIWSALGAPCSETRWNACHTVKKLADFGCTHILDKLTLWLDHDKVDAFGSNRYPFYNFHARQYLLIALSRISVDQPVLLVNYKEIFLKYSQLEPHVLIQKISAEIALNIEKAMPKTYCKYETTFFKGLGKSDKETEIKDYGYQVDSYLHKTGLIDTSLDYHFGLDFYSYWFQPLGDVFGVSGKQVQDLCVDVIRNDWNLSGKTKYRNDPRSSLWNSSHNRDTWYDHGSYPKTDDYDFYLSYHSMLNVAAKLVENMSVLNHSDSDEHCTWESWLSQHSLTRADNKWLADYRDYLPLERPKWISERANNDGWRTDIQEEDFLNSIKFNRNEKVWFNIKGGWTERHNSNYETFSISTSLVSKETANALQRALTTSSSCHEYKIPDYEESRVEIDSGKFRLEGFITSPELSKGIDQVDPYGVNINDRPFSFGKPYLNKLDLSEDIEDKSWKTGNGEVVLKCDTWNSNLQGYDHEPNQSGTRLSASLELLIRLCKIYDCHLIMSVQIARDIDYKYRSNQIDYEYIKNHRIYIITEDGEIK